MGLFRRIFGKNGEETQETDIAEHRQQDETDASAPEDTVAETETIIDEAPEQVQEEEEIHIADADDETEDASDEVEVEDPLDPATKPVATSPLPSAPQTSARALIDGATRPLTADMFSSQDEILGNELVEFGLASHVGQVRQNNQDAGQAFFVTSRSSEDHPDFGLFVVADGMGGHHDGEKASAITVRAVTTHIMSSIYIPMFSGDDDVERIPVTEALVSAVQKANKEVLKNVPEGGTTVTAVAIIGDLAHFAHVGDSRAYLMTKDGADQITRDHSLVQRLIELEQLTAKEAEEHPQKNVLYRALGQNETLEVDAMTRRLPANSRLLLCSDGLWGLVDESDLYEITMNTPDPQQACDKLVAMANNKGGVDNITAVVIKISNS